MMRAFDKGHREWDSKDALRKEKKKKEKAAQEGMPKARNIQGAAVGQVKRRPGVEAGRKGPAEKRPERKGVISANADMEEEDGMDDKEAEELEKKAPAKDDGKTGSAAKGDETGSAKDGKKAPA